MTRHLSSRRRLLVASGLFAFFGLTFTALFPRFFSKPRSLPIQDRSAPIQVQLASFGQDAVPSLEGGVGWINSGPIDLRSSRERLSCSISGRIAASTVTTSCPPWRDSRRSTRTSWSSSASTRGSLTPREIARTSAARSPSTGSSTRWSMMPIW